MDILTADAETFYASDYTLSSMTTEAYVRDPRFEEILWSFKINDTKGFWLLPDRAATFIEKDIDWANTILICHHSHFDGLILSHHHNIKPAMHIDTLSMARVLDGPKAGNSLHDLCIRHGIGAKGDYVTFAKGKHLADFDAGEIRAYGGYGVNDVEKTYLLAQLFLDQMPPEELQVIDMVIRCFTEPVFVADEAKLRGAVASEKQRKIDMLRKLDLLCPACGGSGCKKCDETGVDKKTLGSNDKFAALLRGLGAEPGTKLGKPNPDGSPKPIYAFAKTDPAMQELLEDEDEAVRLVSEARVAVKSSIVETRAGRFADMASRGTMPAYISYGAAHTFRMGGGDKLNWLNISSKHNENRPELSVIAGAIQAPRGHVIVSADSGQGEARICAWGANQHDLVEAFAQGRDVYSEHASTIYGRPVDRKKNKADFIPGQLGKVSILGMGFGMGWAKASMELLKGMLGAPPIQFAIEDMQTLNVDPSRFLNSPKKVQQVSEMPSRLAFNDMLIHCAVVNALIDRYRMKMGKIVAYWKTGDQAIDAMIEGREMAFGAHGVMHTAKDKLWMPNGLAMRYDGIERDGGGQASYWNGRERTKVHGSKLVENVTQSLHYCIMGRQLLDIRKYLRVALTTYDDCVCVVPENAAEEALQFMIESLSTTPAWATGLPLIGEGKIGTTLKGAS
jgi:DNA polymerase